MSKGKYWVTALWAGKDGERAANPRSKSEGHGKDMVLGMSTKNRFGLGDEQLY